MSERKKMQPKASIGIGLITIGLIGIAIVGIFASTTSLNHSDRSNTSIGKTFNNMGKNNRSNTNNGIRPMGHVRSGSNSMMDSNNNRLSSAQVNSLIAQSERGVKINHSTNTIVYSSSKVSLVPLAAPAALHIPGMQWEIDGLINPTIVVPKGASVNVNLINADKGYMHGFEVINASPPFSQMAMRQGPRAFASSFIMPIPPENTLGQFSSSSTQFRAVSKGTYYYICPVPGHAALGMAGKFIVS